ncbi:hypothetical protein [Streptomyces sp. MP131-18]|uniref:hypothetical protein n=1 Tax=Streptomyces sp. MP131-18 TaxID=1857892 RepID=UPI0009CEAAED|nr:hypothetical protein [Streptomyces sp. MP131-18]ONK13162.1 hypothetical protein STBA_39240 [Streptomyces sp. MP131-18]
MRAFPFGVGEPDQQIPAHLTEVGSGWHPLLMRLHEHLTALAPDYRVEEFIPRLGGLRIYLADRYDDEGEFNGTWVDVSGQLVDAARVEAERTCESCGGPGRIRFHGDRRGTHLRALCDRCHTARLTCEDVSALDDGTPRIVTTVLVGTEPDRGGTTEEPHP